MEQVNVELHRKLGLLEAVGLSIALIAPTMGMAFNVSLAAQVAGPAAPLSFVIGTGVVLVVAISFAAWCRRLSHAGSAYSFIAEAFGRTWGFMAGWALLLSYVCYGAGASALAGNFVEAAARTSGWDVPRLWLGFSIAAILASTFLARRNMQLAGRAMVALQGVSMLAILTLAVLILAKTAGLHALSLRPFVPSDAHHGWAGVGYGIVFAVLSFAGFEGAATLGEETNHPRRNVPIALIGTLLVSGTFFVLISYAQVIGYGLGNIQALAADSAPLDTLAVRYASRGYAVALDLATALGSFACVLASLSAAGRILFALGRAGLAPFAGRIHPKRGTPANAILITGIVFLLGLVGWALPTGPGFYYGATGTIGTLSIILVYMAVAWAQAKYAGKQWRGWGGAVGMLGVALLLWPLYNSIYPVPAYPASLWPIILLVWLALGGCLLAGRPALAQKPLPEVLGVEPTL
jgi:amino acid transporter